jgi:hypothetical protein
MENQVTNINPLKEDFREKQIGEGKSPLIEAVVQEKPEYDFLQLHESEPKPFEKAKPISEQDQNYIEAFINNKFVNKVFPDIMNWINIGGNTVSFAAHALNLNDKVKNIAKYVGAFSTKSFMIATSFINIVERCYAKNFLSALGFFNDIIIAGTVNQKDTYLARGTASGTYNMGNSLADSVGRTSFESVDDHVGSTFKAFGKFFGNLFSTNIIENFKNHKNSMWAIFGGLGSNIGAISWMLGAKPEIPTIIRDVCGVMMDIEQLNPGHLKAGRKNFFWSGVALGVGTLSDLFMRFVPENIKDLLVPMTFIGDGLGRHLLRLDRNQQELKQGEQVSIKKLKESEHKLHQAPDLMMGMAV